MISKKRNARSPLTDDQLRTMKASDSARMNLTADEKVRLRKINDVRQGEAAGMKVSLTAEEQPIVAELHSVGLNVNSVWDLVNTATYYPQAISVLLKHLHLPYSDRTREGIARALAVPDPRVREAWAILADEYRKAPTGLGVVAPGETKARRLGAKDGLACALSAAVTDGTLPELIELAKDPAQGESRLLLLAALRKLEFKNAIAKRALDQLADDPDLSREIASWRHDTRTPPMAD